MVVAKELSFMAQMSYLIIMNKLGNANHNVNKRIV